MRLADESAADAAAARPDRGMRVQYDERLYGPRVRGTPLPLSTAFLKKYIAVVKRRCAAMPLTPDAMEAIGDFYAELRSSAADVRGERGKMSFFLSFLSFSFFFENQRRKTFFFCEKKGGEGESREEKKTHLSFFSFPLHLLLLHEKTTNQHS